MTMHFWLGWISTAFVVLAIAMICFAVHEYLLWKSGK